jgi:hypothetical protein
LGNVLNVTSLDGVNMKYSNAAAFGAGMLGTPDGDLEDTSTVKVAPLGALFADSVIALAIPSLTGKATEPVCASGIAMLALCGPGDELVRGLAVGETPPPLHAARVKSKAKSPPLDRIDTLIREVIMLHPLPMAGPSRYASTIRSKFASSEMLAVPNHRAPIG